MPEIAEMIWFLRNSKLWGQFFKSKNTIPQKILLTGPPGTGKTVLVQAIAGEAEVPILIFSGSSVTQPEAWETSSENLKNLFSQAFILAPCIIFIDEIDTFGQARNKMIKNPIVNNSIVDSISTNNQQSKHVQDLFHQENFAHFKTQFTNFSTLSKSKNRLGQKIKCA